MIDGHCHYSDERVFHQAEKLILDAQKLGVRQFFLGGTHEAEWNRQLLLQEKFPGRIFTSFGLHPWWVERLDRPALEQALSRLQEKLQHPTEAPQAIGETGLDFHPRREGSRFELQEYAFLEQLKLARVYQKPLVLHVVKAFDPVLQKLDQYLGTPWSVPVLVHRFSGSREQAQPYLERGAVLSYSVELLDPDRAKKSRQALQITPVDQLSLETDAPDLEASRLPELYRWVAEQRGCRVEDLTAQIKKNLSPFSV